MESSLSSSGMCVDKIGVSLGGGGPFSEHTPQGHSIQITNHFCLLFFSNTKAKPAISLSLSRVHTFQSTDYEPMWFCAIPHFSEAEPISVLTRRVGAAFLLKCNGTRAHTCVQGFIRVRARLARRGVSDQSVRFISAIRESE